MSKETGDIGGSEPEKSSVRGLTASKTLSQKGISLLIQKLHRLMTAGWEVGKVATGRQGHRLVKLVWLKEALLRAMVLDELSAIISMKMVLIY